MNRLNSIKIVSIVKSRFQFAILGSFERSTYNTPSPSVFSYKCSICGFVPHLPMPRIHTRQIDFANERDIRRDIGVVGTAVDLDGVNAILMDALHIISL